MRLSEIQQFDEVTTAATSPDEVLQYLNSDTGERFLVNAATREWCHVQANGEQGEWKPLEPEPHEPARRTQPRP